MAAGTHPLLHANIEKQVARPDCSSVLLGPDCHATPVVAVHPEEIVVPNNAATGYMNNGRMIPYGVS